MRSPTLGSEVLVLDKPKGEPVDGTRWTVWSQSPDGWWLFRKPEGGGSSRMARRPRAAAHPGSEGE